MSKLVLTGPDDLTAQGFTIVDEPTLLDTALFDEQHKLVTQWAGALPRLDGKAARPYQIRYAAMVACRTRNLLAHEQGLGKTYETILAILARYGPALLGGQRKLRRGAIQLVVPRHTMELAWLAEFKMLQLDEHVELILSERDVRMSTKPIWLIDYDFLKRQTDAGRKMRRAGRQRVQVNRKKEVEPFFVGKPMWKLIRQTARPHFVAFDEIHMLRSDSDRTEAVEQYVRGVKNRLGLTGTPVDGWIEHLATILRIIYGENNATFPWTEKTFTKRFTRERVIDQDYVTGEVGGATPRKVKAPGINPDQIPEFYRATRHLLHRLIIRDPEVAGQVTFPKVNYHLEVVDLDPDHQEFYMAAHEAMIEAMTRELQKIEANQTNYERLKANVLQHITLLREAASTPWTLNKMGITPFPHRMTNKVVKAIALAHEAADQGRKSIIFTNQIPTGSVLMKHAKETGLKAVRVFASDPLEKPNTLDQIARNHRIEQFLVDPDVNLLVGNLGLLATGLSLQTAASVVIHHDHDWKANKYRQGNSRVIRPSYCWPDGVDVYDLAGAGTVDNYVLAAMLRKAKANDEMIDRRFSLEIQLTPEDEVDAVAVARALIAGDSGLL
jgi:hypothetical protein